MVLMDSVLSFVDEDVQPRAVKAALQSLRSGGHLVVIGWPNEAEVGWVGRLIGEAAGAVVTRTRCLTRTQALVERQMTWRHSSRQQAPKKNFPGATDATVQANPSRGLDMEGGRKLQCKGALRTVEARVSEAGALVRQAPRPIGSSH